MYSSPYKQAGSVFVSPVLADITFQSAEVACTGLGEARPCNIKKFYRHKFEFSPMNNRIELMCNKLLVVKIFLFWVQFSK